jgi:hypothetical protein
MTKRKPARRKTTTKATAAKTAVTKSAAKPAAKSNGNGAVLIVLGFDDQQKPCGARFEHANQDLVTKAANVMGFKVYRATAPDVAEIAKKLPVGRLYATGRGFVPNIRQTLYSELIVALAVEPQQGMVSTGNEKDNLPVARGLPRSWDEIGPGHLVIAQESLENGWWEALVVDRKDDMFTLQFRDYPNLPRFIRHRAGIALMYASNAHPRSVGQPKAA